MTEDVLFVRIENPDEFRRYLLESLREIIHGLQKFERFREIRIKKIEKIENLNKLQKEIGALLNRLKNQFPEAKVQTKAVVPAKKAKKAEVKKEEKIDDTAQLETQLKDIEEKLNVLS